MLACVTASNRNQHDQKIALQIRKNAFIQSNCDNKSK